MSVAGSSANWFPLNDCPFTISVVNLVPPSPVGRLVPMPPLYRSVKLWRSVVWEKAVLGMAVEMAVDSIVSEVSRLRE